MSNNIVELLQKVAQDITESAAWDEIRSVAVEQLAANGIEKTAADEALKAIAADGEQSTVSRTPSEVSEILLKTASYIADLEAKIVTSEAVLSKVAEEHMTGAMSPFIKNGFSPEEARSLANLPEETLQKLAYNVQMAPSPLGRGAGMDQDSMDPILAFCMS